MVLKQEVVRVGSGGFSASAPAPAPAPGQAPGPTPASILGPLSMHHQAFFDKDIRGHASQAFSAQETGVARPGQDTRSHVQYSSRMYLNYERTFLGNQSYHSLQADGTAFLYLFLGGLTTHLGG